MRQIGEREDKRGMETDPIAKTECKIEAERQY